MAAGLWALLETAEPSFEKENSRTATIAAKGLLFFGEALFCTQQSRIDQQFNLSEP
jgi:hypothetical protein